MTEQTLLDMALGERLPSNNNSPNSCLRVPGGWIYEYRKKYEEPKLFSMFPKGYVVSAVFVPEPLLDVTCRNNELEKIKETQ